MDTDRINGVSQVAGIPDAGSKPIQFVTTPSGTRVNTQFADPSLLSSAVITPESLKDVSLPRVTQTYDNLPNKIISDVTSSADVMLGDQVKQAEQRATTAKAEKTAAGGVVEDLMTRLGQKNVRAGQIAEETGLTDKENTYKQLNLEALSIRNSINQQKEQAKAGTTLVQQQQINSAIDRQAAFQLTDLAIRQAVVGQDIARLETSLNNKLALEFDPIETQLKIKSMLYEDIKDDFTRAEQRQFEALQTQTTNKIAEEKETRTAVNNILTTALKNGIDIPDSVVQQLVKAKDSTEATGILARNGISLQDPLDRAYKQAQIAKTYQDIETSKKKADADNAIVKVSAVDPNSPTYISDLLTASSGGATLTGEQTKPISKALTVIGQIDSLATNLQGQSTGPIVGILRSANPYDVQAIQIKAQLQSIIPNLARGVYGEVGVLTDNDIANYRKTLGNLRTPQQANDLLLSMTLKTIQNGIDDQLEIMASAGRDVSGFKNTRDRLTERISTINNRLGIVDARDLSDDDLRKEFEAMESGATPEVADQLPQVWGFFNSFNQQLFR